MSPEIWLFYLVRLKSTENGKLDKHKLNKIERKFGNKCQQISWELH